MRFRQLGGGKLVENFFDMSIEKRYVDNVCSSSLMDILCWTVVVLCTDLSFNDYLHEMSTFPCSEPEILYRNNNDNRPNLCIPCSAVLSVRRSDWIVCQFKVYPEWFPQKARHVPSIMRMQRKMWVRMPLN